MITSRDLGQYRYVIATGTRLYILFTMSNQRDRESTEIGRGNGGIFYAKDVGRIGPRATFYFANHLYLILHRRTVCFKIIIMFACIRDY